MFNSDNLREFSMYHWSRATVRCAHIQAYTGRDIVHDDEWSIGENFKQRHDEDDERAINLDGRKKEEA